MRKKKPRLPQVSISPNLMERVKREAHGRSLRIHQVIEMVLAEWYRNPDHQFPEIPKVPNGTKVARHREP